MSAVGLLVLNPDAGNLAVGGRVIEPILSEVKVGTSGVIAIRVGFGRDVTTELQRSGPTLNFTLVLHDSVGAALICAFPRTADSTRAPTKWTDPVPQIRLTAGHGCTNGAESSSQTAPTASAGP